LKQKWTYWYLNDDRQACWEDRLKPVCTFSTVEEFWALYNNIRPPSGLNCLCDYNVFKNGIQPMWEVPENRKGGRWLITIEKGRPGEIMDLIWLEILIAMIGEQFGEDMDLICGLVCNVRGKGSKVSDECVDWSAEEGNLRIGQVLKQKLLGAEVPPGCATPLFDWLKYEDHDSCQKKSGSTVKVSRL
uniref:eIF-4F 25 kDa subunit n=1 Tax=Heligmosomoides polygyrus TaxID=6339 RepID=A0A183FY12_HELPZ